MKLFGPFLSIQNQIRIYHWQTESYAQHKAFDKTYKQIGDLIDTFVEIYMGKYGRSKAKFTYNIELHNIDEDYIAMIDSYVDFLVGLNGELDQVNDSDLLNVRDEMLGVFNRLKYLLTLQ